MHQSKPATITALIELQLVVNAGKTSLRGTAKYIKQLQICICFDIHYLSIRQQRRLNRIIILHINRRLVTGFYTCASHHCAKENRLRYNDFPLTIHDFNGYKTTEGFTEIRQSPQHTPSTLQ